MENLTVKATDRPVSDIPGILIGIHVFYYGVATCQPMVTLHLDSGVIKDGSWYLLKF